MGSGTSTEALNCVNPKPIYTSGTCANCDSAEVTLRAPLFCSPVCRQAAELVRYVRACRRDGRDQLLDVREAIHTRMAMVLGSGYPERQRQAPAEVRAAVFRRAGGRCESCGRSLDFDRATGDPDAISTIQHFAGNSNDIANLKAFCRRCNLADAQARFIPVAPGSWQENLAIELELRWLAVDPIRLCDDDRVWNGRWREVAGEARKAIADRPTLEDP